MSLICVLDGLCPLRLLFALEGVPRWNAGICTHATSCLPQLVSVQVWRSSELTGGCDTASTMA